MTKRVTVAKRKKAALGGGRLVALDSLRGLKIKTRMVNLLPFREWIREIV